MSKNLRNQVYLVVNSLSINNITINAPQGVSYTLTLPTTDGTNGQVLTTDGSGVLSWSDANNIPGGSYTGTGLIVRQTSPTLVTPTIGVASGTSLNLTATVGNPALTFNNVISARRIVLATGGNNNFQYYGFGMENTGIKYSVNASTDNHVFYSGVTAASEREIARFTGDGRLSFPTSGARKQQIGINGNEASNFQFTGLGIQTGEMIYNGTNSSLNHSFYSGTGAASAAVLFRVLGVGGFISYANSSVQGSLTISTPLGVTSGGTGTGSIGTPGQYAIVNAGATGLSYTTGPGGGGVTSVGLAGDSTFNNIFTITTSSSNPIVNSGILTINVTNFTGTGNLVLATSPTLITPVLGVATATSLTASGTVTAATLNATGLTASQVVFTDGSKNLTSVGTNGTGNVVLTTSPTLVTPTLGAASATSLTASGTVTAATLNATGLTASQVVFTDGSKNLTSVATNGTGNVVLTTSPTLVTPTLGVASATSLTASGTVTAATLNATGLTASQVVFTDGSKNLTSVGTNGTGNVVLTTSPTLVTPTLGAASATSLTASGTVTAATLRGTGLTASGVVLTDGSSNLTVPANGANGTVLTIVGGVPAWSAVSALGAITATTITASGTVTAATLNATGLTASRAVFTDGSKNLVSVNTNGTGNVVLTTSPTLVTPNVGFATATGLLVTGGSSTDIGLNLNAVVANRRVSFAGSNEYQYTGFGLATNALKYSVAASTADHIFYRGETAASETELFKVKGGGGFTSAGDSTVNGILEVSGGIIKASNPIWGGVFQTTSQNVSSGGDTIAQDLTTATGTVVSPGLTLSATGYTNNTGRTVAVYFSYSVFWDPALGSGVVQAGVMKNNNVLTTYGSSSAAIFATTHRASCTGSGIVLLDNTDYIELRVKNNLGGALAIKGTDAGTNFFTATQLYYYILN
jgi:hypothetical protein